MKFALTICLIFSLGLLAKADFKINCLTSLNGYVYDLTHLKNGVYIFGYTSLIF